MDETAAANSGDPRDGEDPRGEGDPRGGDALSAAAARLAQIEASDPARDLLAELLTSTLTAFTGTGSVRDALTDTAADSIGEALAVVAGIDHLRSSLTALDASWQVIAERRIREDDHAHGVPEGRQGRGAAQELGLARRVSPSSSALSLAAARRMVQHLPKTLQRVKAGTYTEKQATTIATTLDGASPETLERIDEVLDENPHRVIGQGCRRVRSDLKDLVQHFEPEKSPERAERAARRRHVTLTPLSDGMACLKVTTRAIDAAGALQILKKGAEAHRAAGAKDTISALEADLLIESILFSDLTDHGDDVARTKPRTTPGLDVGIILTDTALLDGAEGETAILEGYGSIPAHIITSTLLGNAPGSLHRNDDEDPRHADEEVTAVFRRLYTHPTTGQLTAMDSRARTFPTGLARMIRWRDQTCRTPWCDAKIRHTDHAIPFHKGGPTSYGNGQGLCARCNYLKEHGLWTLTALNTGPCSMPETTDTGPAEQESRTGPPPPASPPTAWHWTSPHGAHGTSVTPPLLHPRTRHHGDQSTDPHVSSVHQQHDADSGPREDPPGLHPSA